MNVNNIITLISAIRNLANDLIMEELKKEGIKDIVPSHGYILFSLFKNDGITMSEINKKINKKKNTVTVLIEKLSNHGFIRKENDLHDKRITRVYLTEKGKTLETAFNNISVKLLDKTYTNFSDDEKLSLMRMLIKIRNNLS